VFAGPSIPLERCNRFTRSYLAGAGCRQFDHRHGPNAMEETMTTHTNRPTIVRIWRGRTTRERADEYEAYNYEVGIKPLIAKAMGVQTLREDRDDETEFITISYWESVEAMSRFTGGDPSRIHHLDRDREFLIELPERVQVLGIRYSHGNTGSNAE
jgi:heme-degrading monooxygenase HmoA